MYHHGSKKQAQYKHFKKRLRERYGIDIDENRYNELVGSIKKGKAIFVERQSCRISVHKVEIQKLLVPVVYDGKRHSLVTALPGV